MKKLFLLISAGVISLGALAQDQKTVSVVFAGEENVTMRQLPLLNEGIKSGDISLTQLNNGKTTVGGTRNYNYVNFLGALNNSVWSNASIRYLWRGGDILSIYVDSNGNDVFQPVDLSSYSSVFHPQADDLNSPFYEDEITAANPIAIKGESYTIDSIGIVGAYGRNPSKPDIVDTLRIAFVYGELTENSDLISSTVSGPTLYDNYGTDQVNFVGILYDSITGSATTRSGNPSAVIYRDIYLDTSDLYLNDQGEILFAMFATDVNLTVPANNLVGISVTFVSGEPYTPYVDTVFFGFNTTNPNGPFNYGMFLPRFFEENAGGYPTYREGNFNAGNVKYLPMSNFHTSWMPIYMPLWAFNATFSLEFPDITLQVSCATCKNTMDYINVNDISNIISNVSAYPNPAQDYVRIPVTLSKATDVKISLVNTVGQTLQTQQLHGNTVTAEFNTAGLPDGVYIYSVEADGQRSTGRVSISR